MISENVDTGNVPKVVPFWGGKFRASIEPSIELQLSIPPCSERGRSFLRAFEGGWHIRGDVSRKRKTRQKLMLNTGEFMSFWSVPSDFTGQLPEVFTSSEDPMQPCYNYFADTFQGIAGILLRFCRDPADILQRPSQNLPATAR